MSAEGLSYTPLELSRSGAPVADRELDAWGMDPEWLGKQPTDFAFGWAADKTFWRYQYDVQFAYKQRLPNGEAVYPPVEFRTYVYWVGEPPSDLKQHIKTEDNGRLQHLFNSGPYGRGGRGGGYMRGYRFSSSETNTEDQEVAADEVNNLGIPQFEVLLRANGSTKQTADVVGSAGGYFDPFALYEEAPEQTRWKVTENPARNSYELRPEGTRARARLTGRSKQVYVGGRFVGNTVPTRPGTVWVKKEYGTKDGTYKDSQTGQQMWSRQKLIDDAGIPPGGIRSGDPVYKVRETEDTISLVATRANLPDGWTAAPDAAIVGPEEAAYMDLAECTTFEVRKDTGPRMGRYDTPTVRDICESISLIHM